jgi:hypothetical protein
MHHADHRWPLMLHKGTRFAMEGHTPSGNERSRGRHRGRVPVDQSSTNHFSMMNLGRHESATHLPEARANTLFLLRSLRRTNRR